MAIKKHPITVAEGDGIGPEIMQATLKILEASGAQLEIEKVVVGEKAYLAGIKTGIDEKTWASLRKTKVLLKAPITTPQGGGYRSVNVTIRTKLGLFANVRPCRSYSPFIATKHPAMDVVIVRENEEDLYTGVEYRQTPDVTHAIKLISRYGSEKIIRYAFEYAREQGRKKVSCFTKDNILKITDGLFHRLFEEIGEEFPELEKEHYIVDIGAARLADTPEKFDLIVLPNLYGDILSDVTAQITGSVGLGGSANIGDAGAMFEAIHGSAPKYAGQNAANPSGLLLAAIMMLVHIHQLEPATKIHNAWLKTIEEGIHTPDIYKEKSSHKRVGTQEFAEEVIKRLGKSPQTLKAVSYTKKSVEKKAFQGMKPTSTVRKLIGVDLFIYSHESPETLHTRLQEYVTPSLKLQIITNRGVEVWPQGIEETSLIEVYRCRYIGEDAISLQAIASLLHRLGDAKIEVVKMENLYTFDGQNGFY